MGGTTQTNGMGVVLKCALTFILGEWKWEVDLNFETTPIPLVWVVPP